MPRREAGASRPGREVIRPNHWSRIPSNNASNVTRRRRARITCIRPISRERWTQKNERPEFTSNKGHADTAGSTLARVLARHIRQPAFEYLWPRDDSGIE